MKRHFSLRGHKVSVSTIQSLDNALVSADRNGWVIVWNVSIKRPIALWQAHTDQIITVQNTPLGLLTHARDSSIRIWDLRDTKSLCNSLSKLDSEDVPKPPCVEIPVNALNFCNVELRDGLLATPSTKDSEKFDLYKLSAPGEDFNLTRTVHAFPPAIAANDLDKREGDGIIMKLRFINKHLLFVGYESGTIRGFHLVDESTSNVKKTSTDTTRFVSNKDLTVQEVFSDSSHSPQPVLSLEYDAENGLLYSGSASKKMVRFGIGQLSHEALHSGEIGKKLTAIAPTNEPKISLIDEDSSDTQSPSQIPAQVYNLRHAGVQGMVVGDPLYICFWDGVIKCFDRNIQERDRYERQIERVRIDADLKENTDSSKTKKASTIASWKPLTSSDSRLLTRIRSLSQKSYLFVGYNDGLISAYTEE